VSKTNFIDGVLRTFGLARTADIETVIKSSEAYLTAEAMFGTEVARLLRLAGRSKAITERIHQLAELRSWVYACVDLIVNECATTPYLIEKMVDSRTKTYEATNDLDLRVDPLLAEPFKPYGDWYTYMRLITTSLAVCGDFFVWKAGTMMNENDIIGLTPMDPTLATPIVRGLGWGPGDLEYWSFRGIKLTPDRVLFGRIPRIDDFWRGMSPIEAATLGIDLNVEGGQYNIALLRNDARPSLLLSPEDEEADPEGLEKTKKWAFEQRGSKGGVKILPMRFKKVDSGLDLRMLDMTNMRKLAKDEILAAYHTPETLITGKDANKSTMPTVMQFWLDTSVSPMLSILENTMTAQVIKPLAGSPIYRLRFKRRTIESAEDKQKRLEMEFANNAITVNDYRLARGEKPYPWGDEKPKQAVAAPVIPPAGSQPPVLVDDGSTEEPPQKILVYRDGQALQRAAGERAMKWAAWDNLVKAVEPHLVGAIARHFDRSKSITLKRAKQEYESTGRVSIGIYDQAAAAADLEKIVRPFADSAIERGHGNAEQQVGHKIDGGLGKPAETFALQLTTVTATEMPATTKQKIADLLARTTLKSKAGRPGAEDIVEPTAISYDELERQIGEIFDEGSTSRAASAGATVTVGAVNWGTHDGYRADGIASKEWLSQQDDRVRDSHQELDSGESIAMEAKFANGLMFPGDPDGDPAEIINCRCTLLPVV
jgi:phage portal protein BeeE